MKVKSRSTQHKILSLGNIHQKAMYLFIYHLFIICLFTISISPVKTGDKIERNELRHYLVRIHLLLKNLYQIYKILKKTKRAFLCLDNRWTEDSITPRGSLAVIMNFLCEKWRLFISLDFLNMICTNRKNKITESCKENRVL